MGTDGLSMLIGIGLFAIKIIQVLSISQDEEAMTVDKDTQLELHGKSILYCHQCETINN